MVEPTEGPMDPPPWTDGAWQAASKAWIAEQLARLGLEMTGPPEPRARPWSIVERIPTSRGAVFFKATAGLANDAALSPLLARLPGTLVVEPLAFLPARRWMLLPDAGERMRETRSGDAWLAAWGEVLPRYAELQRATGSLGVQLAASGLFDYRPAVLPDVLLTLLDEREWLDPDDPAELAADEIDRLRGMVAPLRRAGERLAAAGIGETIQHDDLHDGNILVGGDGMRVIDWGDAALAHPFGTLLVTLNGIADHLELPIDAPEVGRLRDAYLEAWTDRAPMAELRQLSALARWTAMVGRAATWRSAVPRATRAERAEWGAPVSAWLRELLDTAPAPRG